MPLCVDCKAEVRDRRWPLPGASPSLPPHGMEWGKTCGRCERTAGVVITPEGADD